MTHRTSMGRATARLAVAATALACAAGLLSAGPATADYGLSFLDTDTHTPFGPPTAPPSQHVNQAGAHADSSLSFRLNTTDDGHGFTIPDKSIRDAIVSIPPGFIGNPLAVPRCQADLFAHFPPKCSPSSQVGIATTLIPAGNPAAPPSVQRNAIYNLVPPEGEAATFGFYVAFVPVTLTAKIRTESDHGIDMHASNASQGATVFGQDLTLWGVPPDPIHDHQRFLNGVTTGASSNVAPRPFLTLPPTCPGPVTTVFATRPWGSDVWVSESDVSDDPVTGLPEGPSNCDRVPFDVRLSMRPSDTRAGTPAPYTVTMNAAFDDNPRGIGNAHVKDVSVTLPEGVAINPSAGDGLQGCSPEQLKLGTRLEPECPAASKVGDVQIDTPVLEEPVTGELYLRTPREGQMFAAAIVARGPGFVIKLPGDVDPDPQTGRIVATFENNPQLPFERVTLKLKGGPRAPLANPRSCGTATTSTTISSWAGHSQLSTDSFEIDRGPDGGACREPSFTPTLSAGTVSPRGGSHSPFSMTIAKRDGDQDLRTVEAKLPKGLLAKLAGVAECPEAQANAGTCGEGSRIGHVQASAGAGSDPLWVPQAGKAPTAVYLAGPYKGAPYSLSAVVPAQAGPYDLGKVVVRVALHVDRTTAAVTAVSDPIPHILEGVPLNVREVRVLIDRANFTLNPTSCAAKEIAATVGSVQGASSRVATRFQAGDCTALPFKPRLGLALTGRNQRTTGKHPGVKALVRQKGVGEAGIQRAKVTLPKSVALDPENAQALCEFVDGTKPDLESHCPKGSIVGRAQARTPLLDTPLKGNVYFVKNVRRDRRTGNLLRTLPMIVVALRGEIAINLTGKSSTAKDGRLINTFAGVPDAPISRFNLNINGGKTGILAVTGTRSGNINLCANPKGHIAQNRMRGQNGKNADYRVRVKTPCAAKKTGRKAKR